MLYEVITSMGTTFNLSLKQVRDIIQQNKRGVKPEIDFLGKKVSEESKMEVTLDGELDRFDKKKTRNKIRGRHNHNGNQNQVEASQKSQQNNENRNNRNRGKNQRFRVKKKSE